MTERIAYKLGYKYQLQTTYHVDTGITGLVVVVGNYLMLTRGGILAVFDGYCWDGATAAIDTPSFMRGSLCHDALYQLIREGSLPISYRKRADELLIELCKQDGMSWLRRQWVWAAVRAFGARALENDNPVLFAPEKP